MVKKNNLRKVFTAFACLACAATCAAAFAACGGNGAGHEGDAAALTSGTYWAELQKVTMGSNTTYTVHFTLDATANTYYFSSYYVMADATRVTTESGTYTDNGTEVVFKTEGKADLTATISDGTFTLEKDVIGMGMSTAELTYEKGGAPAYVTYFVDGEEYGKVGYKNSTDEVVPLAEPEKAGFTFSWGTVPETAGSGARVDGTFTAEETGLASGTYDVDVTWSTMYEYNNALAYHLIIDASAMTFEIENQTGDNKGTGTITVDNDVYTLNYSGEQTTTFTYDSESKTITFTSKVWIIGTMVTSLNRVDAGDGVTFVPYTAELMND